MRLRYATPRQKAESARYHSEQVAEKYCRFGFEDSLIAEMVRGPDLERAVSRSSAKTAPFLVHPMEPDPREVDEERPHSSIGSATPMELVKSVGQPSHPAA